jgi:hypothetical protein
MLPQALQQFIWARSYVAPTAALQAEHEGPVTALGASPEGLRVCSGTECGTVGVLDITTHQYTTLLRSHTGRVLALAADPNRSGGGRRAVDLRGPLEAGGLLDGIPRSRSW